MFNQFPPRHRGNYEDRQLIIRRETSAQTFSQINHDDGTLAEAPRGNLVGSIHRMPKSREIPKPVTSKKT